MKRPAAAASAVAACGLLLAGCGPGDDSDGVDLSGDGSPHAFHDEAGDDAADDADRITVDSMEGPRGFDVTILCVDGYEFLSTEHDRAKTAYTGGLTRFPEKDTVCADAEGQTP